MRLLTRIVLGLPLVIALPFIGLGAAAFVIYMGIEDARAQRAVTKDEKRRNDFV